MIPAVPAPAFLALLLILLPSARSECSLHCKQGAGQCANSGQASWGKIDEFHFASPIGFLERRSNDDGEYCACEEGHAGLTCRHEYEICDEESGFACFHGSTCVRIATGEAPKGDFPLLSQKWMCDCKTAEANGKSAKFAGHHCEYEATEICDDSEELEEGSEWFCTNGGKCNNDVGPTTKINRRCKCDDDWFGLHCEYHINSKNKGQSLLAAADSVRNHYHFNCTLDCDNGGQCAFGVKDFEHLSSKMAGQWIKDHPQFAQHQQGMHCVCPAGFTGIKCDVKAEKCGGNLYCYNGSQCKRAKMEDGSRKAYCDCAPAADTKNQKSYTGIGCQHKSTTTCEPKKEMRKDMAFCANGGTCELDEANKPGCQCPEPWTGRHCGLHKTEDPEKHVQKWTGNEECTIKCLNGGRCAFGVKDYGKIEKYDTPFLTHVDFEHCICPEGYTGVDCSVPVTHCPNSRQVCFYGSECTALGGLSENLKDEYMCHCEKGHMKESLGLEEGMVEKLRPVAGRYCEHIATEICAHDKEILNWHSFCTNGGKCIKDVRTNEPHAGCVCDDKWTGDHCETKIRKNAGISGQAGPDDSPAAAMRLSCLVMGVAGALLAMAQLV